MLLLAEEELLSSKVVKSCLDDDEEGSEAEAGVAGPPTLDDSTARARCASTRIVQGPLVVKSIAVSCCMTGQQPCNSRALE